MASPARSTVSSADAAWLRMDRPTNLMVINSVLWFDAPLNFGELQDVMLERLVGRYPRFRQRIVEGGLGRPPAWEDADPFEPDLHFHRRALPSPGDRSALQEVVSDLVAHPLDRARPLWDVYLLERYGPGCAVLVRMHHAIADGIALARVMLSLTDDAASPSGDLWEPGEDAAGGGPLPGVARLALSAARAGVRTALRPAALPGVARSLAADGRTLAKQLLPFSDARSPLRAPLGVAHRVAWSDPFPLRTAKRIAHAAGATVNDVLVAAVTGSLRHEVLGDDAPDEIHAVVPFNLRPLDAPVSPKLGNHFGLVLLALPVGIADPMDRLRAVHDRMGEIKDSHEGPLSYGILEAVGRTPDWVESRMVDLFSGKGSLVLTNVPGPRARVSLAGREVRGVLVWAPCSGPIGLSVSIFSYSGSVTVGFLADSALVPDPQPLADGVRREVLALSRRTRRTVSPMA